jgi:hypothetical protein
VFSAYDIYLNSLLFLPSQPGVASKYDDPFDLISLTIDRAEDLRMNTIPTTCIVDHVHKTDIHFSFHELHLLGGSTVLQLGMTPRVSSFLVLSCFSL